MPENTATDTPNWESLIASRLEAHPETSDQRIQDPSARNMRLHGRRYDNSERGRARGTGRTPTATGAARSPASAPGATP